MKNDKKYRILIMPSDLAGVGHFRSIWLAQQIDKDFADDFYVEINVMPDFNDVHYFKSFDLIHFHRQLGPHENMDVFFKDLKDAGVILVMDLDDYWAPPTTHPLYGIAVKEKLSEKITKTLRMSDYVSTTTDIFAKQIMAYNKNVVVMPNGLDMNQQMWKDEDTRINDKVRISWIGGSSHQHDLMLLKPSMKLLHNDESLKGKYQIVMCGYDTRGHVTIVNEDGVTQETRKITPAETIWNKFEEIFTDNYNPNIISAEYQKWLKKYKNEPYPHGNILDETYVRRWTLPLTQYGKHYNYCDICLAPLEEEEKYINEKGKEAKRRHYFNEVKSELKIIEAGMKKKVLIAQDFSIYKDLIKHNVNGLLVNKPMHEKGWYGQIKKVIENKDLRETLANNLHQFVKERYNLERLTEERIDLYYKMLDEGKLKKEELQKELQKA